MKLINYRCPVCGKEVEFILEAGAIDIAWEECPKCGGKMTQFNFKNNSQRVRINDQEE